MSDDTTAHFAAIKERARKMWEADGSPEGQLPEYLERARELQAIVENPGAGQLPNPMIAHPDASDLPVEPIEEAALQDNLGEFPDRVTDQGDRRETPMTREQELHPDDTE